MVDVEQVKQEYRKLEEKLESAKHNLTEAQVKRQLMLEEMEQLYQAMAQYGCQTYEELEVMIQQKAQIVMAAIAAHKVSNQTE